MCLTQTCPELVPCVLEASVNLCLSSEGRAYEQMVRFGLQLLSSADAAHLPVVVRFLLESAGVGDVWGVAGKGSCSLCTIHGRPDVRLDMT